MKFTFYLALAKRRCFEHIFYPHRYMVYTVEVLLQGGVSMSYGSGVYNELPDAASIIADHDAPSRSMNSEVNSRPKEHATVLSRLSFTYGVHELLQCPVCSNTMYPPIIQCQNGHTLCSNCPSKVNNRCPSCQHDVRNIRCLALEMVAELLEFSCRYQFLGCQVIVPYRDKVQHEEQCRFRPYNCPYAGSECSISGDIPTLISHLRDHHKVDMHVGSTFNHRYVKPNPHEVEKATWMLTVFNCFGKYFCLHFEAFVLGAAPVYIAFLRFMGEEDEANGFRYSLEVGGSRRKQVWQGVPRSIRDSHETVCQSVDGLLIPRGLALSYFGGGHGELKLRVTGQIWEEHRCHAGFKEAEGKEKEIEGRT